MLRIKVVSNKEMIINKQFLDDVDIFNALLQNDESQQLTRSEEPPNIPNVSVHF